MACLRSSIGIVAYGLVVLRQRHFSALAGGVALAIMMVPTITRTTEEMLLLVPQAVREAAYGLGVSRWRTTLSITLRTATSGVITGVMLAFARVAGETAPLLFTAFGNQYWNWKLNQPTAALPLQIFTYAISPFDEWHRQAWAGALDPDRPDCGRGRRGAPCGQPRICSRERTRLWALASKSTS